MLELLHVSKSYRSQAGGGAVRQAGGQACGRVEVIRDISLSVEQGQSVAIMGPSGSGKSTLLNIIGALDRPDSGLVLLDGRDITSFGERELAFIRNRRIGFVFQLHHLLPQCTVLENILVPTLASHRGIRSAGSTGTADVCDTVVDSTAAQERAKALLERVGLSDRMGYLPGLLSGGQRQRVAVVRAMINKPSLILADEPTGSLDRAGAEDIGRLLVELNRTEGVSLVVVTHSGAIAQAMERVFLLRDGLLIGQ